MEEIQYEDRIVCFVDFLGFRDLVGDSVSEDGITVPEKLKIIFESLAFTNKTWLDGDSLFHNLNKTKKISQFSDSVAVSFEVNDTSGVFRVIDKLQQWIIVLAAEGIFVRGGIAHGKLFHNERFIFGPALIQAYDLEHMYAKYPRIVFKESIVDLGVRYGRWKKDEKEFLDKLISQDDDGYYYIDYIEKARTELPDVVMFDYLPRIKRHIEQGLLHPKTDVKEKYQWLAAKFNSFIDKCHRRKITVSADSMEEADSIFEEYASIPSISL